MRGAWPLALLALLGADGFQSRSPYNPCNPYSGYCQPQLGSPYVDAGSAYVNGNVSAGHYSGNDTQPGPQLTVLSPYFDGGNTIVGNDFVGVVTLRNNPAGSATGQVGNPVFFVKAGVQFDGGFVCGMGLPMGFNGAVQTGSNDWTTIVQDGGCWYYNGTRSGNSQVLAPPVQVTYFFNGL